VLVLGPWWYLLNDRQKERRSYQRYIPNEEWRAWTRLAQMMLMLNQ
jgi:hypothetical protein